MQTILLIALLQAMPSAPATAWLPPAAEETVVSQLVERLGQIDLGWTYDRAASAARTAVASLRLRIEKLGEAELLKRAPALTQLKLPASGDPRLDAMARYQMCVSLYFVRHELRATEKSEENRMASAVGLSAGSLVMLFLRHAAIASTGTAEPLERFLNGSDLLSAVDRIQRDAEQLAAVQAACTPVFRAIIQG